jgi:hypothetical protein
MTSINKTFFNIYIAGYRFTFIITNLALEIKFELIEQNKNI